MSYEQQHFVPLNPTGTDLHSSSKSTAHCPRRLHPRAKCCRSHTPRHAMSGTRSPQLCPATCCQHQASAMRWSRLYLCVACPCHRVLSFRQTPRYRWIRTTEVELNQLAVVRSDQQTAYFCHLCEINSRRDGIGPDTTWAEDGSQRLGQVNEGCFTRHVRVANILSTT